MNYEIEFLNALLRTVLIETAVLFLLVRLFLRKKEIPIWTIILTGIVASFATLPYLWFIFPMFFQTKLYYIIISELFAVFIESFILFGFLKINYKQALIFSLACNLISYAVGVIF